MFLSLMHELERQPICTRKHAESFADSPLHNLLARWSWEKGMFLLLRGLSCSLSLFVYRCSRCQFPSAARRGLGQSLRHSIRPNSRCIDELPLGRGWALPLWHGAWEQPQPGMISELRLVEAPVPIWPKGKAGHWLQQFIKFRIAISEAPGLSAEVFKKQEVRPFQLCQC